MSVDSSLPSGLGSFLRALWGFEISVRGLPKIERGLSAARPRFLAAQIWLPTSPLAGVSGSFTDYLLAAAAHAAAHVRFGGPRFAVKALKPAQIAIISVLEDARVERLAAAQYPGLARLWAPFHVARADGAKTSLALLARLARALHDADYIDDDAWVNKGRELFSAQRSEWQDPDALRRLGSTLGNDLGQMRVQFNAKDYTVQPPYRDDNIGLWQFEQAHDGAAIESEATRSSGSDRTEDNQSRQWGTPETVSALQEAAAARPLGLRPNSAGSQDFATRHAEWDYVIARERLDFCSVFERFSQPGDARQLDTALARYASARRQLQRSAEQLASRRPTQVRRLLAGDRIDLSAALAAIVATASGAAPNPRVYRRTRVQLEPPALLLLLDLSESLNAFPTGSPMTLLELARAASGLLATSLRGVTRDLAIHGFSSNGRHDVSYYRFKDFDEPFDERARARLAGMRAQLSTRLGAALRHAGRALKARPARRKLLLVVSDGEPSDIDVHDQKYLIFDAKHATQRNRQLGITSYCVGLDASAAGTVQRIFGAGNYLLLDRVEQLPQRLSQLYLRLSA